MVRIRLKRMGAKNQPAYRVVVVDGRSPRDGRFIEEVGYYLPLQKGHNANLKMDRVDYWLKCGAQPSETVASMIARERKTQAV
ncbi:MAG: 30S ribosomal protein S16 [Limisphaerales bacterium]|jgi:small subunit ribosomal protein S16|nr:30S ribosomal protein S16 [Verrucomicrobiota bacterium]